MLVLLDCKSLYHAVFVVCNACSTLYFVTCWLPLRLQSLASGGCIAAIDHRGNLHHIANPPLLSTTCVQRFIRMTSSTPCNVPAIQLAAKPLADSKTTLHSTSLQYPFRNHGQQRLEGNGNTHLFLKGGCRRSNCFLAAEAHGKMRKLSYRRTACQRHRRAYTRHIVETMEQLGDLHETPICKCASYTCRLRIDGCCVHGASSSRGSPLSMRARSFLKRVRHCR